MSNQIIVPSLGESVTEATVSKWLKEVGEKVNSDEPLVELETDKVNVEVPSPSAGTLSDIKVKEGDTVEVGALLGTINAKQSASENIEPSSEKKIEEKVYEPPKKNKQVKEKQNLVKTTNRNVRSSTRKISLILRAIVGKKVEHALRDLSFANQRISKDNKKTINTAVADAENNFQYDIDSLFIKEAYCGKSIVMKRFRPRAKGRASPIKKPYSNVTIILSDKLNKVENYGSKS